MKRIIVLFSLLIAFNSNAQNPTYCDSVLVDCCTFGTSPGKVIIQVYNQSSYLFSYPQFIIFDGADTIAKESTSYFGIGAGPQQHDLVIQQSFSLPFTGVLKLYSYFGDSLECVLPIFIADTITGLKNIHVKESVRVYPNPVSEILTVESLENDAQLEISDCLGRLVYVSEVKKGINHIPVTFIPNGVFLITVRNNLNTITQRLKLIRH